MTSHLVSRAAAGLRQARSTPPAITSEGLTVHYVGDSPWGRAADRSSAARFAATTDHNRCATIWRGIQAWQMDHNGWNDIAYSSGVCPHGVRYEGRGPGRRTAANGTNEGNRRSAATCYIAGGSDPLTDGAKRALADEGSRLGRGLRWLHREWKSTACPGESVAAWKRAGWPAPGGSTPAQPDPILPPGPPGVLKTGARGIRVVFLQAALNAFTARTPLGDRKPLAVDGIYGPRTTARVLEFERWANAMARLAGATSGFLHEDGFTTGPTLDRLAWWRAATGT